MEKTLLITSIYSDLWGTEYGGRPSRKIHYRESLLNIINLNVDKIICFTSNREIDDLNKFFYMKHNISKDLLEFRVFELNNSKYFKEISSLKDLDKMKTIDRCFEIQYNKFFWFSLIDDKDNYDRLYWIDAGLSHGGLFPDEYWDKNRGTEKRYHINLFNSKFIEYVNEKTKDKLLLLKKNNGGQFFWSQTLPKQYYDEYNNKNHIIGGMFGGKLSHLTTFIDEFEKLLKKLLTYEKELFMEEQIMSCLYVNHINLFTTLDFDDWYKRERHKESDNIKYFYEMFLLQ